MTDHEAPAHPITVEYLNGIEIIETIEVPVWDLPPADVVTFRDTTYNVVSQTGPIRIEGGTTLYRVHVRPEH